MFNTTWKMDKNSEDRMKLLTVHKNSVIFPSKPKPMIMNKMKYLLLVSVSLLNFWPV